ncbi:toxin YoeB (plasmid) [Pararobbsia alpina]|uniref:Txe/YoeB family addiction module toxin n=1 Tax=Pararobbsia alpina TaxID=621374 RepID=UPI0039A6E077
MDCRGLRRLSLLAGQNKRAPKRINQVSKDVQRTPLEGICKPEPLKANLTGLWSRRIDDTNRFVYEIAGTLIDIVSCRYHY